MGLFDSQEKVSVNLRVQDWATVIVAMGRSDAPLSTKDRINSAIFDSARETKRVLT